MYISASLGRIAFDIDPDHLAEFAKKASVIAAKLRLWERVQVLLALRNPLTVVLIGPSGVGKSQLLRALESRQSQPILRSDRTQNRNSELRNVGGKLFNFVDTPGHIDREWMLAINECKPPYVILNVVAYGYHEGNTDRARAVTTKNSLRKVFHKTRLADEQKFAENLRAWIRGMPNQPNRVITVVNKSDLWWSEREAVRDHYDEYLKKVELQSETIEVATVIKRFFGRVAGSGEVDFDLIDQLLVKLLNLLMEIPRG
ncbi:MAG: GTPase [Planctomycetota bacterium]